MNLSDLLSGDVIEALAKSAGASKKDTSSVLANALPTLMKSMASNASTKDGAKSLEKALDDHTSDDALSTLLGNIDLEDGSKILGHILGKDSDFQEVRCRFRPYRYDTFQCSSAFIKRFRQ